MALGLHAYIRKTSLARHRMNHCSVETVDSGRHRDRGAVFLGKLEILNIPKTLDLVFFLCAGIEELFFDHMMDNLV